MPVLINEWQNPLVIPDVSPSGDGVMTVAMLAELTAVSSGGGGPLIFTAITRPAPNDAQFAATLADGRVAVIWNSTDKQPNYTDGVNWYDASGNLT